MKQIIPFNKEITLKNKIKELTSISLDNDLTLKGEDLITGNFYLKGSYKTNTSEEEYSYKIPCEIAISDDYDTYNATIDIDDFNYDVKLDKLNISISLAIDGLEKKEVEVEPVEEPRCIDEEEIKEIKNEEIKEIKQEEKINIIQESKKEESNTQIINIEKNEKNYRTYSVYLVKEEDTINHILEKYKITKDMLEEYNNLDNFKTGDKIIIPCHD